MSAKLIQVIEVDVYRGEGTKSNPGRRVMQYWTTDGMLLAENDPQTERLALRAARPTPEGTER